MTTQHLEEQGFIFLGDLKQSGVQLQLWENDDYFILYNPKKEEIHYEEAKETSG